MSGTLQSSSISAFGGVEVGYNKAIRKGLACCAVMAALATQSVMAQYALVDDFESYTPGALATGGSSAWINNGGAWYVNGSSSGTSWVQIQNDGDNYLAISDGFSGIRAADRTVPTIADGSVGTYYFQILETVTTDQNKWGLTQFAAGSGLSNNGYSETAVSLIGDGAGGLSLVAENGAGAQATLAMGLSINTWYDIWMVIDNAADTYDVYLGTSGDANTMGTLVGNDLNFRHGIGVAGQAGVGDLVTFWSLDAVDAANSQQSGRVDNIYYNPVAVPEPSSMALGLVGGFALLLMSNRRRH